MLIEQIKLDQEAARKEKRAEAASLLTTLLGEAYAVAKNKQRDLPTDSETETVINRFLKGIRDTTDALNKMEPFMAEHAAAVAKLARERIILEGYLPKKVLMSEAALTAAIRNAIAAGTKVQMGPLMGYLSKNHAGQFDGRIANSLVGIAITQHKALAE